MELSRLEKLMIFRKRNGLTTSDIAKVLGKSQSFISQLENKQRVSECTLRAYENYIENYNKK